MSLYHLLILLPVLGPHCTLHGRRLVIDSMLCARHLGIRDIVFFSLAENLCLCGD